MYKLIHIHSMMALWIPNNIHSSVSEKIELIAHQICSLFWYVDEQTPAAPKSPQKKILFVEEISGKKVSMEIELEEATIVDSDSDSSDFSEGMNFEFIGYRFWILIFNMRTIFSNI